MNRFLRLSLSILCVAAPGGCAGLLTSDEPADHVYWLEAVRVQLGEPPQTMRPSLVVVVDTVPGLDTDRILVRGPGAILNHYAGARWPDHLPELLSATTRLALESSGRFLRVGSGRGIPGDAWSLELELREFFAVAGPADSPPEIHVLLAGHLNCDAGEIPVRAGATARAGENRLGSIVAAFQEATDETLRNLGSQLATHCL